MPNAIKRDNSKVQTGEKWKEVERDLCINGVMMEPHTPWENMAEKGIDDLSTMTAKCISEFGVPLGQHHWCQKWCKDAHNALAMQKLGWRSPSEQLTSNTPDMSPLRFHMWEKA